ncbi:ADP-ribosylglycohydrolase [Aliidongia dinghuensis]|uniref:ADP-ribosylglycohydrolase n=1 Tax=Aliidongia dinghuensis TaxID=1867774 RepID=A0A8J2YV62_9PROT|nr:ADP-ribosylarginine hydrolase Tri1 [Aliidongia dinghuensis]GGF20449.1 ADP-ribosylglycohydrolase [Aliidongia dinghuensis]
MIDLRDPTETVAAYARRYDMFLPPTSYAVARRMQDPALPAAREVREGVDPAIPVWLLPSAYEGVAEATRKGRAVGALLGLAVGDAVGTTLEFRRRDEARVTDMVGGGPFHLQPGEWTDDTSTALCLADSLLAERSFVPADFAARLARWYRNGENSVNGRCFDIGITTRDALEAYLQSGRPQSGSADPSSAGNGSLVRLAPLAIYYRRSLERVWTLSQAQSRTTHNAAEVLSACQFFGILLWHALNGASKEEVLAPKVLPVQPRVMIINAGEYKQKTRDRIRSSGYVIDTLEAALWSVWTTDNFEDAVLTAANLADDADSVAAAAGQLAGALYGVEAIPERWRARIAWHDRLVDMAAKLFDTAPAA